eukprot:8260562-Ditylum_brightwellii.AAC.1
MERLCGDLEKNKKLFGNTFFGDFATILKNPFLNILGSGTYCPIGLLEVIDCTSQLLKCGGNEDASFIANNFQPHLHKLDPDKDSCDLALFDGANNVQK